MSWHYVYLFFQSNLLEIPFYWLGLCFLKKNSGSSGPISITMMNSVTHPLVFFGFMNLPLTYLQNILLAEAFAITAEGLFLRVSWRFPWSAALLISAVANLVSWQLGPLLTYWLLE